MPERGHIAIFDRSWYGRVLVERVRGFAAPADWRRAYAEICEFERQLLEHGLIVAKFWLQVSKAEQLRRFKARDEDPLKRFKVDPEDWTNRTLYDAYQQAAAEMISRTHTRAARWTSCRPTTRRALARAAQVVCETIEGIGGVVMRRMLMSLTALACSSSLGAAQAVEIRFYPQERRTSWTRPAAFAAACRTWRSSTTAKPT